jgi:SAM-dependent methyltransferase
MFAKGASFENFTCHTLLQCINQLQVSIDEASGASQAADFHLRWAKAGAPLRPPPPVLEAMRPLLAGRHALQLGVTPEIALLPASNVAVDFNAAMIRVAWPGDSKTHRAVFGNWLEMPMADASVDAVFGDASFSVLDWPADCVRVMREVKRVLQPGGRLVMRCFAGPDQPERVDEVAAAALAGAAGNFNAFKLRFNMAAFQASEGNANTGRRIHGLFERHFPDRARLAAASGWTLAEIGGIDAYAGSPAVHSYPTRAELGQALGEKFRHRFLEGSGYELAERCPLLIADVI